MTVCKRYKVGGAVRDQILGVPSKDIDYSIEAPDFATMRQYILDLGGKIFLEQEQYLTIRAQVDKEAADFVLCRRDGTYSGDGRRPDFVEPGTILDDLARRDFTMNAIAIGEDGSYIDPFDGQEDIKNKLIRCVGTAEARFTEDSLRLLRAVRFCITKEFSLDEEIEECLHDPKMIYLLDNISVERMVEELRKCFVYDTRKTLYFLDRYEDLQEKLFGKNLKNGHIMLVPTIQYRED